MDKDFRDSDLFKEFMDNVGEYIYILNNNLLQLESGKGDHHELLNEMFRAAHSIKGMSGMVGINQIMELSHKIENILDYLRQEKISVSNEIIEILFDSFDNLGMCLECLASDNEAAMNIAGITGRIDKVLRKIDAKSFKDKSKYIPVFIDETIEGITEITESLLKLEKNPDQPDIVNHMFRLIHRIKSSSAALGFFDMGEIAHNIENILDDARNRRIIISADVINCIFFATDRVLEMIKSVESNKEAEFDIKDVLSRLKTCMVHGGETEPAGPEEKKDPGKENEGEKTVSPADTAAVKVSTLSTLRVDIGKLDELMNLAGEMVVAKARLLQIATELKKDKDREEKTILIGDLNTTAEQINKISLGIQKGVMQTRMVPIGGMFKRFGRVVRDIASLKSKKVKLEITGEDTELDRKVIDELIDPLTHIVRNAVDHGIEAGEERIKNNKTEEGNLRLNAYHEANSVCIEVVDDGRGLDFDKIKKKAVSRGLVTEEEARTLSREETSEFIFAPGFSTAEEVTEVSGRGVGMDIVKEKLKQLNGNIAVDLKVKEGSRFVLRVPLTLAIISAILFKIEDEIFAVPIDNVSEIIQFDPENLKMTDFCRSMTHRDKVLPIIYLHETLGTNSVPVMGENCKIMILRDQGKYIGLVVDVLMGREEITIKSLADNYKHISGIMGGAILGDGKVCFIIDTAELFSLAKRKSYSR
ncbi:MAG: chemotaxis protein CheA [Elusimicrobia bacterium]|nr:chemotaxis protein CheA [Elusimicrobiota bacterium]